MSKVTVKKPTKEELQKLGIDKWPTWTSEVKKFDWEYSDNETFYVHEGKVKVTTTDGQEVEFGKGDLVTFPKGVKCTWDVQQPIRKVYNFG
ncbi:MAG: cupin domain-containing protein [Candidatus Omnitrophica bacterium]|nr:cupin domain-containing protein [Candidatus Omnitrophota bacterium]